MERMNFRPEQKKVNYYYSIDVVVGSVENEK